MSAPASDKWQRRLFVAKDGFLLYYATGNPDAASFDTKAKGAIPLGGCKVELCERGPKAKFGLKITHPDFYAGTCQLVHHYAHACKKRRPFYGTPALARSQHSISFLFF